MRIDAHQHFWKFNPVRDEWIDDSMTAIRRDFYPENLEVELVANGMAGSIAVQSDQSISENEFHLELAQKHQFIRGVVGWVDFQAADISEQLARYKGTPMKGFRHVLQGEQQRDFMLRPAFMKGIAELAAFGYTFDILIYPDQLAYAKQFVKAFPDQPFVIDHLAKPLIRDKKIDVWKNDILAFSRYENVFCKISGMVTEAQWVGWKNQDFTPYIETVVESFGVNRLMFGSDWPVCLVAARYAEVVDIVTQYFSTFSRIEQEAIFGGTAIRFYNL
ncbi:MAG: amidohydrolase family protein [Chryseolinea sp.]